MLIGDIECYDHGMETAEKTWLTRQEAAERAGVHLRTVARWLAEGTLTGHRVRGRHRVRIDASEVDSVTGQAPRREAS